MDVTMTVNGESTTLDAREGEHLASALRRAGYTGVKCGCDGGDCGASMILVDGEATMACGMPAADAEESTVETIGALGTQDDLHPIQAAFVDNFAVQCGFCIPGMIMQSKALLAENPDPTAEEVRTALDDIVCRCTGYQKPVEAVLDAAERMGAERVATDGGTATGDGPTGCTRPDCCGGTDE